ncbi:MAG: cardiolipin synthase [Desulforhopalus sp.]|jgi:cardiolipin synthase
MIGFLILLFHILGLISAFHAVMSTRTSQGAIAWVVSLITFPYLALPAYWILGRSRFNGYVKAHQASGHNIEIDKLLLEKELDPFRVPSEEVNNAARAAEKLANMPYLQGNHVDLLIDGEATFDSIVEGIQQAEEYILFQFFIVHDDQLGRRIKEHLIAKAKENVRIYFLYDEIGSHDLPKTYVKELRDVGIEVCDFHTRKGPGNRFQINFRNHCKVVVIDGKVAWIGGHNVGDEYLGKDPKFGHWRDTHIRIEGPVVLEAQASFVEDWYWAAGKVPQLSWKPIASADSNQRVLIVPTGPADELETATLMFLHAINSAISRIWIASPYFVPDESIVNALQLAGLRGVDVRILIPDKPDHLLVYLAAFSYFDEAGSTGVRFFRYLKGFLHEKVMLIDDQVATVGTANFDNRSFRLNFEITAIVADEQFAATVEQMFIDDFENSREIRPGELDEKGFWFKLAVRLARLTAPVQ